MTTLRFLQTNRNEHNAKPAEEEPNFYLSALACHPAFRAPKFPAFSHLNSIATTRQGACAAYCICLSIFD